LSIAAAADPITRTVTLAWDASPSPQVIGYRVHYGTHSGNYSQLLDVGNQTQADVPNLVDGTTYFFTITAYTATGDESAPTDELVHTVSAGVLVNISARASVGTGNDVVIAGFIVGGSSRKTFVIRALGPALAQSGVKNALQDPVLELHSNGQVVAANDNWRNQDTSTLTAYGLAPKYDSEAALALTLAPGAYTVIVHGHGAATGTALLAVYDIGVLMT